MEVLKKISLYFWSPKNKFSNFFFFLDGKYFSTFIRRTEFSLGMGFLTKLETAPKRRGQDCLKLFKDGHDGPHIDPCCKVATKWWVPFGMTA